MNAPSKPFRGGRVFSEDDAAAADLQHQRTRYPCAAQQCPMPGTLYPSGSRDGLCAWHYGTLASDWPRISQVLVDWGCVSYEVDECRRVHTASESAADPKAQETLFANAVERLRPLVAASGWGPELEPKADERYANWGRRLEEFLGARVVERLTLKQRRAA